MNPYIHKIFWLTICYVFVYSNFRLGTHTSVTDYDYDYDERPQDPSTNIYVKDDNDRYLALGIKDSIEGHGFYVAEELSEKVAYSEAYYHCLTDYWSLATYRCATPDDGADDYPYYDYGPPQ